MKPPIYLFSFIFLPLPNSFSYLTLIVWIDNIVLVACIGDFTFIQLTSEKANFIITRSTIAVITSKSVLA